MRNGASVTGKVDMFLTFFKIIYIYLLIYLTLRWMLRQSIKQLSVICSVNSKTAFTTIDLKAYIRYPHNLSFHVPYVRAGRIFNLWITKVVEWLNFKANGVVLALLISCHSMSDFNNNTENSLKAKSAEKQQCDSLSQHDNGIRFYIVFIMKAFTTNTNIKRSLQNVIFKRSYSVLTILDFTLSQAFIIFCAHQFLFTIMCGHELGYF